MAKFVVVVDDTQVVELEKAVSRLKGEILPYIEKEKGAWEPANFQILFNHLDIDAKVGPTWANLEVRQKGSAWAARWEPRFYQANGAWCRRALGRVAVWAKKKGKRARFDRRGYLIIE